MIFWPFFFQSREWVDGFQKFRKFETFFESFPYIVNSNEKVSYNLNFLIAVRSPSPCYTIFDILERCEKNISWGRFLSQTAVKAQVSCFLSRIHQVGPGNKQIAKKRQWALQQDEKMRKERSAQWIRRIEGVNTLRKGMIRSFGWKAIPIYSKLKNCFLQIVEI